MALSMEKTRSVAAELGVTAKTIRAASAHAGNLLPLTFYQLSTPSVKAWLSLRTPSGRSWRLLDLLPLDADFFFVQEEVACRSQLYEQCVDLIDLVPHLGANGEALQRVATPLEDRRG